MDFLKPSTVKIFSKDISEWMSFTKEIYYLFQVLVQALHKCIVAEQENQYYVKEYKYIYMECVCSYVCVCACVRTHVCVCVCVWNEYHTLMLAFQCWHLTMDEIADGQCKLNNSTPAPVHSTKLQLASTIQLKNKEKWGIMCCNALDYIL